MDGARTAVIEVAAIVGSLRQASNNQGLLRAALAVQPDAMRLYDLPIRDLPHYDADTEQAGERDAVREFKAGIVRADALLFCTPEYNYGLPGVLKNAIDWASRPGGQSVLRGKPAAIMGASTSATGTARAQLQLRQTCVSLDVRFLNAPQVFVGNAKEKFDATGNLTDAETRDRVRALLDALLAWTLLLRAGSAATLAAGTPG